MTDKGNVAYFGGENSEAAARELERIYDHTKLFALRGELTTEIPYVHCNKYDTPDGELVNTWLLDQVKQLDAKPDWAVITHANDLARAGQAFVLRNHDGHMDVIDFISGVSDMCARDIEIILEEVHGVRLPVYFIFAPLNDQTIHPDVILEREWHNPDEEWVRDAVMKHYPQYDNLGTLADPINRTKPNRDPDSTPDTEQRTVELTPSEYEFLRAHAEEITDISISDIDDVLEDFTFTGTWDEFRTCVFNPLDDVGSSAFELKEWGVDVDTELASKAADKQWKLLLDWHR